MASSPYNCDRSRPRPTTSCRVANEAPSICVLMRAYGSSDRI
jgi:hypothetical protein